MTNVVVLLWLCDITRALTLSNRTERRRCTGLQRPLCCAVSTDCWNLGPMWTLPIRFLCRHVRCILLCQCLSLCTWTTLPSTTAFTLCLVSLLFRN